MKKVGIVGGGASGMFAAIHAAKEGAKVTIMESGERLGKKILSTGNGKCNLTNLFLDESCYYSENMPFVMQALEQFGVDDTLQAFKSFGLLLRDKNGYIYPSCEQAAVVSDMLRYMLKSLDVEVLTEHRVTNISQKGKNICIQFEGREALLFDSVILASGGRAMPKSGSDGSGYDLAKKLGHEMIPVVPALVQLHCEEDYFKGVSGVRTQAKLKLYINEAVVTEENGELQLTDIGISGIPVFQISRLAGYALRKKEKVSVVVDCMPDVTMKELRQMLEVHKLLDEKRTAEEFFNGLINKKLMGLFMRLADIKPNVEISQVPEKKIDMFCMLCKEWKVRINGTHSFDNAQVCAGGINTLQIGNNMESKLIPGLFFAGEIMDVDGKCGGYNLQWAWTSGAIAGRSAARRA